MKMSTGIWLAEIILTVVAGYFALAFAILTWVSITDIANKLLQSKADDISPESVVYSVMYFVVWAATTYVTATALKAARRGGKWKWR